MIEPDEFHIEGRFDSDGFACLFGTFRHRVRATGQPFPSDWALVTEARDGGLVLYHFYEYTDALAQAMRSQATS